MNDYFKNLDVEMKFENYDEYKNFLLDIYNEMIMDKSETTNVSKTIFQETTLSETIPAQ